MHITVGQTGGFLALYEEIFEGLIYCTEGNLKTFLWFLLAEHQDEYIVFKAPILLMPLIRAYSGVNSIYPKNFRTYVLYI